MHYSIVFMINLLTLFCTLASTSLFSTTDKCILLVGGAGYVGSQVNATLCRSGYSTIILDDLSTGSRDMVKQGIFIQGDYGDSALLDSIFTDYSIDAVMHFAGTLGVAESFKIPLEYYSNNVAKTIQLLLAMERHHITTLIFSSSSTVYGIVPDDFISETCFLNPISPYGRVKLMIETILEDVAPTWDLHYCCLRYFSPAGGDPLHEIKNTKPKDYGMIQTLLRRLVSTNSISVTIFGTDYPTPDGTCIRDYVHVQDIATAHILAVEKLFSSGPNSYYNIGTGKGTSVREVIAVIEEVTGCKMNVIEGDRRNGDPARIVADIAKIQNDLGWNPLYSDIKLIVEDTWQALKK